MGLGLVSLFSSQEKPHLKVSRVPLVVNNETFRESVCSGCFLIIINTRSALVAGQRPRPSILLLSPVSVLAPFAPPPPTLGPSPGR